MTEVRNSKDNLSESITEKCRVAVQEHSVWNLTEKKKFTHDWDKERYYSRKDYLVSLLKH